jgi:hypothetical protein
MKSHYEIYFWCCVAVRKACYEWQICQKGVFLARLEHLTARVFMYLSFLVILALAFVGVHRLFLAFPKLHGSMNSYQRILGEFTVFIRSRWQFKHVSELAIISCSRKTFQSFTTKRRMVLVIHHIQLSQLRFRHYISQDKGVPSVITPVLQRW